MEKSKLLIILAIISFVAARDDKGITEALKFRKFVENNLGTSKNLREDYEALTAPADKFDNSDFRLPNNTRPTHYDLHVSTEIHSGNFTFEGVVRINVTVVEASNTITLHSRGQTIHQLIVQNSDGTVIPNTHELDAEREFLIISVTQALQQNQEITLEITFSAVLETLNPRGFIRLSTTNPETNVTTWMAKSHFHPINARHGYPCYDEVTIRATYQLAIRHHNSYNAIANTRADTVVADGTEYTTTTFEPIPSIPSYILAYAILPLPSINETANGVLYSVFGRPEAIEAGELDNSLEVSILMLQAMENLFNITYDLDVSNLFAAPGFDAAHNWGLIAVNEDILRQVNDDPEEQHRREMILGHEYSHIFFANLVSPEWWTFLWLNEGIATFYENVLADIVFPEKNQWERFLIDFFDASIANDIFDFVEPMHRYVETPAEIRSRFNFISYQKAALVLRMFQQGMTDEVWTLGVSNYLVDRSLNSASPQDLFVGLRSAVDQVFPGNSLPDIATLMHTWLNFAGYPVVTVRRNGSNIVVTQEGFRTSHDELFGIPLAFTTASNPNFELTIADFWMQTRELTITPANTNKNWTDTDWIIFNLRDTGYYVTNYDEPLWRLIIDALNNDHEAIHFLNRGTLYADLHRFISENYDIRASLFLDMMQSLPLEMHPHVWVRANAGLFKFETRLRGSRLHAMHLNFVREIMTSVYGREFDDPQATNIVNRGSCLSGVESCRTDALNALLEEFETGSTTFATDYRCSGFLTANETVWRHFFNLALEQSVAERTVLLGNLLCSTDRELKRFYLNQTLDLTNSLTMPERELILHIASFQSETSYDILIVFVEENHAAIGEIMSLENLIIALSAATNTECQAERVLYLTRFLPVASNPGRNFFRNVMIPNLNFYDANFDQFHEWYDNFFQASRLIA